MCDPSLGGLGTVWVSPHLHGSGSCVRGDHRLKSKKKWGIHESFSFPGSSEGKASAYNAGDLGSIPGSGRSPGEGNGNPFQYSCLENPMDRGAWGATVHGVTKSRTRLSDFSSAHLCSGINALWYSLYTGLWLFASLPLQGSPSMGLLDVPQVATWELFQFTSMSMARREVGSPVNWLHGTQIRQKANGWQVRLLLWSPSSRLPLLSRDQTCASCLLSQHLSETRKDQACQRQGSAFSIVMTVVKTVNITENQREKMRTSLGQPGGRRPTLHLFLPSQEITGAHYSYLRGPASRDLVS